MFALKLLGGMVLEGAPEQQAGRAAQKRRLALLAVLAMRNGSGISRDKLLTLFWPESPADEGRRRLSAALYDLRKALGEKAVLTRGDEVVLPAGLLRCDALDFDAAAAATDWERAADLYAGPFLDGVHIEQAPEFETWADAARLTLSRTLARVLEEHGNACARRGDLTGAVAAWQRLAEAEPLNDRVALQLMRALDAAGNRAAALRHSDLHAVRLRAEIGVEPDEAIGELAAALRQRTERVAAPLVGLPPTANRVRPRLWQTTLERRAHFVGQHAPAQTLRCCPRYARSSDFLRCGVVDPAAPVGRAAARRRNCDKRPSARGLQRGRNTFRAGRFDEAIAAFNRAVSADSNFLFAQYRLATATLWSDAPATSPVLPERALADKLTKASPYESLLLRGYLEWRSGSAITAEMLYRRAVSERPNDPEPWFQLGETLFHYNPIFGRPMSAARAPFEKTLALAPRHYGALWHLALIAGLQDERAAFLTLTDRLLALHPDEPRTIELNAMRAVMHNDAVEKQRWFERLRASNENLLIGVAWRMSVFLRDLDYAAQLYGSLAEPARSRFSRRQGLASLVFLDLARGHVQSARQRLPELQAAGAPSYLTGYVNTLLLAFDFVPRTQTDLRARLAVSSPFDRVSMSTLRHGDSVSVGDTSRARDLLHVLSTNSANGPMHESAGRSQRSAGAYCRRTRGGVAVARKRLHQPLVCRVGD